MIVITDGNESPIERNRDITYNLDTAIPLLKKTHDYKYIAVGVGYPQNLQLQKTAGGFENRTLHKPDFEKLSEMIGSLGQLIKDESLECQPQDCALGEWSEWGECAHECIGNSPNATGTQTRKKTKVTDAKNGGNNTCPDKVENGSCTKPCDVDCEYNDWSNWSITVEPVCNGAPKAYGESIQILTVKSEGANNGNRSCYEQKKQRVDEKDCRVNCTISEWGEWSECKASCDGNNTHAEGNQTRAKHQLTPPMNGGLNNCTKTERQTCTVDNCPVDCKMGEWSAWSTLREPSCDTPGNQTRVKEVEIVGENGGNQTCAPQQEFNATKIECFEPDAI
eukprot:Pgem_evm1s481